jgi:hypothetical protein
MVFKRFNDSLIVFAIVAIPILTVSFGLRASPFDYTLSMIGNWFDYFDRFVVWGIITSVLISVSVFNIYKNIKYKKII